MDPTPSTDPYNTGDYQNEEVKRDYTLIPAGTPCKYCDSTDLWVEWRIEYFAKPITEFSLAGGQVKFSTQKIRWPWAVCGGCGHASKGKIDKPESGDA